MIARRALLAFAALALASPLAAADKVATTYVMRHLDTPAGERDPDLTDTGKARADALVRWFKGKRLTAIYVTPFKRTAQSVAALAAARRLTPKVYGPAAGAELIAAVRAERGPVLIVGHSNTVPDIVEQLGGARPAPLSHPDFGDVWTIEARGTTRATITP
jgi:phosphohistidine phosphatase SixA